MQRLYSRLSAIRRWVKCSHWPRADFCRTQPGRSLGSGKRLE
jgi:hypothetical protein